MDKFGAILCQFHWRLFGEWSNLKDAGIWSSKKKSHFKIKTFNSILPYCYNSFFYFKMEIWRWLMVIMECFTALFAINPSHRGMPHLIILQINMLMFLITCGKNVPCVTILLKINAYWFSISELITISQLHQLGSKVAQIRLF